MLTFPKAAGNPKKKPAKQDEPSADSNWVDKDKHGKSNQAHEKKDNDKKHGKSKGKGSGQDK